MIPREVSKRGNGKDLMVRAAGDRPCGVVVGKKGNNDQNGETNEARQDDKGGVVQFPLMK